LFCDNSIVAVQYNSTYPDACYPDCHLTGSAWPFH